MYRLHQLARRDVFGRACEGHRADQRLVEHDSHAVPVGWTAAVAARLLRRHVGSGTDPGPTSLPGASRISDQPKVKQHHPTAPLDEGVGRFHITVNLVGAMQGQQSLGETLETPAQPLEIEPAGPY